MANNNVEIEIKVSLDKESFFNLKNKLDNIAKFVKNSKQIDSYLAPAHRDFTTPKPPFEWLSIRKRDDKTILNYKHFYPEDTASFTHCDEFETEIHNPNQLNKIFSALNFKKLITVEKEREIYMYNDEFEIALDIVNELGYFIEIEALKDFGGVDATRKKLFEFAKTLGINNPKTDKRGYPFLLMKKKGLIKQKISIPLTFKMANNCP